ncbi:hypothetical protein GW923_04475 [Candidatus Pacearchaeota archaeon]|nr:hypothetical protein [Candidatus Pacearchaeota archaeon]
MDKEINFVIKKGVYCSWCADLMKKTLLQNFAIKNVKVNILKETARIIPKGRINAWDIISFLKKRGYSLKEI